MNFCEKSLIRLNKSIEAAAIDKNATPTAMVGEYLSALTESEIYSKARKIQEVKFSVRTLNWDMGK